MRVITDTMLDQARNAQSGLTREERSAIFEDAMLESRAANARYSGGSSVKDTVDALLQTNRQPSFKRADTLGRAYHKMAIRRLGVSK